MKAVGQYLLVKDDVAVVNKTAGGLELTDKHEEIRYINAEIKSVGDAVSGFEEGDRILYDKVGGHTVVIEGEVFKIIRDRDITVKIYDK